ncbi:hypothetical protein T4A_12348 [Trichinella pseudospiralis]|uniref:Uncharacterized protein n=1 Tax=Trichinella pseudospiralis TaxID=6337 RepID=A0A0V1E3I7_TRIPS|nr:hypothetical protein T4A_12348 [Trichinella pseudospiralis]
MAYCSGEVDSVIERGERKYCARSVINRNYINEQPGPFQASEKHVLWTRSNLLKPLLGFSFHNIRQMDEWESCTILIESNKRTCVAKLNFSIAFEQYATHTHLHDVLGWASLNKVETND